MQDSPVAHQVPTQPLRGGTGEPRIPTPGHVSRAWAPSPGPAGRLAFVSDRDGLPALWTRIATTAPGGAVAWDERRVDVGDGPVQAVSYAPGGAWIAVVVAPRGGELREVRVVRPGQPGWRLLAGGPAGPGARRDEATRRTPGTSAALGPWAPDGSRLAVCESDASGLTHALLVDPATGARERVASGVALEINDLRMAPSGQGWELLVREGPRGRRRLLLVDSATGTASPLLTAEATLVSGQFTPDPSTALVATNAGRRYCVLLAVDLPHGRAPEPPAAPKVLADCEGTDLEFVVIRRGHPSAVLAYNVAGRSELDLLDLRTGETTDLPAPPLPVVTALSALPDGQVAVAVTGPGSPGEIWSFDPAKDAFEPLVAAPRERAVHPRAVTFRAADGLDLTGWLYTPEGTECPGPAFIYLHGGPELEERPGHNALAQALADRGITVLAANVRGSTGHGQAFERADDFAGRFNAIADVAACRTFLVDEGIADAARVGVGGRSYGGYLTLAALVTYPELFRVGVDICGMADLQTFYADTEPWIAAAAVSKYGDPERDADLLRALSPLHRMNRLAAPLLVVHGANDTNVGVREAEQAYAAARSRGVDCRCLVFDNEGHEVTRADNVARFLTEVEEWVVGHLGVGTPASRPAPDARPTARPREADEAHRPGLCQAGRAPLPSHEEVP